MAARHNTTQTSAHLEPKQARCGTINSLYHPMEKQKHIHIIGICGVATGALAAAFHDAGWKVTGSDKGFYPPVSTQLQQLGITYYAGWHPEKMMADGTLDLVVAGTASGSKNPETAYCREQCIPVHSYTSIFRDYFIRKNSIVCVGTWGKTTSTTMLSYVLDQAGFNPSYMFGGISLVQPLAAKMTSSNWSVFEGDEYKSGPDDPTAKFFSYKPTHLLMSAIAWDHADLYPTEADYLAAFRKLIRETRTRQQETGSGIFVACTDAPLLDTLLKEERVQAVGYGKDSTAHYRYEHVQNSRDGISFTLIEHDRASGSITKHHIESPMLGGFNAENITGVFAMAREIGIPADSIIASIRSFSGIKRRFERRTPAQSPITVLDCHAPTADKARAILESVREIFPKPARIIAIYEPNIGGRKREALGLYAGAFEHADTVYIPRLTKLKTDVDADTADIPIEGDELAATISQSHPNTQYNENDDWLVTKACAEAQPGDCIVFMGSHGFRGMIEAAAAGAQKPKA